MKHLKKSLRRHAINRLGLIDRIPILMMIFLASASPLARGNVVLPLLFGDHMVLQCDIATPIWGKAAPGEVVTVTVGTVSGRATAGPDGKWIVPLAGLTHSNQPVEIIVEGKNKVVIHDVLLGDVWLCSGQSNMEYSFSADASYPEEKEKANDPQLRIFVTPPWCLPHPEPFPTSTSDTNGRWIVCPDPLVAKFSAVGYYFGREIRAATGMPVGLIGNYWAGTPIEAWISLEMLQGIPALKTLADAGADFHENYDAKVRTYRDSLLPEWKTTCEKWKQEHAAEWNAFQAAVQQWGKDNAAAHTAGKSAPPKPKNPLPPEPLNPQTARYIPSVLYNGMIHPTIPYGLKGVIWYQGEQNAGRPNQYALLLPAMIRDWRSRWNRPTLPFLIVQLPNMGAPKPDPQESSWARLREVQAQTATTLPGIGLATTIDLGEWNNVHPPDKYDVAHRLALLARKQVYGENIVASGPAYTKLEIEANRVRLHFENAERGLVIGAPPLHWHRGEPRPDTTTLRGFAVAGADRKYHWASAVIDGATVVLSCNEVINPITVRYNWADTPNGNLYNREGLPATPFRTDTYPAGEVFPPKN